MKKRFWVLCYCLDCDDPIKYHELQDAVNHTDQCDDEAQEVIERWTGATLYKNETRRAEDEEDGWTERGRILREAMILEKRWRE